MARRPKGTEWQRPSHRELNRSIEQARLALEQRSYRPANPAKLRADLDRLGLFDAAGQIEAIQATLAEISPEGYVGAHPPQRSYEPVTRDLEMFAFCWQSRFFGQRMYFKFCLRRLADRSVLYIFSLHRHREHGGE